MLDEFNGKRGTALKRDSGDKWLVMIEGGEQKEFQIRHLEVIPRWDGTSDQLPLADHVSLDIDQDTIETTESRNKGMIAAWGLWLCSNYYLLWKFKLLCKLTFGIWTDELYRTMRIQMRTDYFDVAHYKSSMQPFMRLPTKQEDTMIATGESHSIVWQLCPYVLGVTGVVVSKLGEALNASPIYVTPEVEEKMRTSWGYRFLLWLASLLEYIFTLLIIWQPEGTIGKVWLCLWALCALFAAIVEAGKAFEREQIKRKVYHVFETCTARRL